MDTWTTRLFTKTDGAFANCIRRSLCITNYTSVHDESDEQKADYIPASRQGAKLRSRHREIWRHGILLAALYLGTFFAWRRDVWKALK